MRVLVSNDDGYQAPGIQHLVAQLSKKNEVWVVAPNKNCSGASSSLTLGRPLQPKKISERFWCIDGTPTDCVHLALCGFLNQKIDAVVTGINAGSNLGDDVIYSGTVAGAIEGRFLGLPSLAISLIGENPKHFETASMVAKHLVEHLEQSQLSYDTILNINVPDVPFSDLAGFQTTRLGKREQSKDSIQDVNQPGYYWIGENGRAKDNGSGTDFYATENQFVSLTPLQLDLTKHNAIEATTSWVNNISLS